MAFVGPVGDSRRYTVPAGAEPVGSGGEGFVYRATRTADGAPVALKCLVRVDPAEWRRLVHRARLVAQVAHPALGRHLDAFMGPHPFQGEVPADHEFDEAYLVAAWVEGRDLTEAAAGADLATVLRWVRAVGHAANALHRHPVPGGVGMVHRDIKPGNVIVGSAGAVLVDLGVARPTDGSTATVGVGSPGWLPPEAYDDPAAVGPRSDLWQVAGLASWAVDGQPPGRRVAGRHRQHLARALAGRGLARPRRLAAHIDAGLAARPADRPPDLRRWCDELVALAEPSPAPRVRRPILVGAVLALVALVAAGAGWARERTGAAWTGGAAPAPTAAGVHAPPGEAGTAPLPAAPRVEVAALPGTHLSLTFGVPVTVRARVPAGLGAASVRLLLNERLRPGPAGPTPPERVADGLVGAADEVVLSATVEPDPAEPERPVTIDEIVLDLRAPSGAPLDQVRTSSVLVFSPPVPGPEECRTYDKAALRLEPVGESGWVLTDGGPIAIFGNAADAERARAVADRSDRYCWIGGELSGPRSTGVGYWRSGDHLTVLPPPTAAGEDCRRYEPQDLLVAGGGAIWDLREAGSEQPLVRLRDEPSARQALNVARRFGQLCFIGRNTPDRRVDYWRP